MASKLPTEIWVDREAMLRPNICSHISKRNEFEPGVRMRPADELEDNFAWWIFSAFAFGVVWTLALLFIVGSL